MTREEAKRILYVFRAVILVDASHIEAFEIAIKALEQEDILDKIRAEIEQEYKVELEHPYGQGLRRALEIIDKYKAESEDKE